MVKMRQKKLVVLEFEDGDNEEIIQYIQNNKDFICNHCLAFHQQVTEELRDFLQDLKINYFQINDKNIFAHNKQKSNNVSDTLITCSLTTLPTNAQQNTIPQKKITITFDSEQEPIVTEQTMPHLTRNLESIYEIDNMQSHTHHDAIATQYTHIDDMMEDTLFSNQNVLHDSQQRFHEKLSNKNDIELKNYGINVIKSKPLSTMVFKRAVRSGEEIILNSHATFLKSINVGALIRTSGNLHIFGKCDGILESFGDYIIIQEFSMGRISLQGIDLEGKMLEKVKSSMQPKMLTIENENIVVIDLL